MTSLHPPSFHRNDFSTCSTHFFNYGAKHQPFFVPRNTLHTRMRTRTTPRAAPAGGVCISLSVTISAFFRIEFWPAWLSPRMRLSSPDHSPLIARTRVLAICSFCRFSRHNTASGRFYQPGETFMTHLNYS